MITLKRTDSSDKDFQSLVVELDKELRIRDGEEHAFFAQFNQIDHLRQVVLAYDQDRPVGCGAVKPYEPGCMEIKRMFVPLDMRGRGIAGRVLRELEQWALELGHGRCVLETGDKQPEAIRLYEKSGYQVIPNYGQYVGVNSSVCFEKVL